MRIICDENIPGAARLFGRFGEVACMPGRAITRSVLDGAEMLLVRSVTRVDRALLEGTRVRFVASATIGTDHIDLDYLGRSSIRFAHAPGSNAWSVAEYVSSAIVHVFRALRRPREGATVGIVGLGNVGSRVRAHCHAMGMRTLVCDPPIAESGTPGFVELDQLLGQSDIVTLHVPLTRDGPHPTWHLLDERTLRLLRRGTVLTNTSRGGVVDEHVLQGIRALLGGLVLDVWEGEPKPRSDTLKTATLATPHIAGYSLDGKLAGTRMIYEAACAHLGTTPVDERNEAGDRRFHIDVSGSVDPVGDAIVAGYAITCDDARMRALESVPDADRAALFDALRRDYPTRHEFTHYTVHGAPAPYAEALAALRFQIA